MLVELREKLRGSWRTQSSYSGANVDADARGETDRPGAATEHDLFDADDFLSLVRRLQRTCPEYCSDAELLAGEIAGDDRSTEIDVVKEAAENLTTT